MEHININLVSDERQTGQCVTAGGLHQHSQMCLVILIRAGLKKELILFFFGFGFFFNKITKKNHL